MQEEPLASRRTPSVRPRASRVGHRGLVRSARTLLLGAAATLGVAAIGAAPAVAAPAITAPTTGTINGSFTVPAGTTNPSNVNVELVNTDGYALGPYAVDTATSATAATYQFSGVTPGRYYLYFNDTAPGDNVQADYYGDGGADSVRAATVVDVTAGGTVTLNQQDLRTGAEITGTVTDANHASESFASIQLSNADPGISSDPNLQASSDVTLANGSFTIAGLPAGSYHVNYRANGSTGWTIGSPYVSGGGVSYNLGDATSYATKPGATTTVNFSVPAVSTITGTVSSAQGPLAQDFIQAFDGAGDQANATLTGSDGTYSMDVLPGTYKVSFGGFPNLNLAGTWFGGATEAQASNVVAAAGATVPNINATLGAGGTITGTVVSARGGVPLGDIEVDLVDAQGNQISAYETSGYTKPDGTYQISDVPAGTWYVRFDAGVAFSGQYYAQEFYGGTQTEFGAKAVTVNAGQTTSGINAAMLPFSVSALGLPTATGASLSGLHNNRVALRLNVAAGTGSGYLKTLTVALPRGFNWHASALPTSLSLGSGVTYAAAIINSNLVVTLTSGQPSVALTVSPGAITVSRSIERAAGGLTHRRRHHRHHAKHHRRRPARRRHKDRIRSELIRLSVGDTTGTVTSLPVTINRPR